MGNVDIDASFMPLLMQAGLSKRGATGLLVDVALGDETALRELEITLPIRHNAEIVDGRLDYPMIIGAKAVWRAPVLTLNTGEVPDTVVAMLHGRSVDALIGPHPGFAGRTIVEAALDEGLLRARLDEAWFAMPTMGRRACLMQRLRRRTRRPRMVIMMGMHRGPRASAGRTLRHGMGVAALVGLAMSALLTAWTCGVHVPGWIMIATPMALPLGLCACFLEAAFTDEGLYDFDLRYEQARKDLQRRAAGR